MIKKMWAVFKDKKYSVIDNEKYEQLNKILPAYIMYEYKPIWVCDRDPHENVRKVLEKLEKVNNYLELGNMPKTAEYYKMAEEHLTFALKKDLKNTEGAG